MDGTLRLRFPVDLPPLRRAAPPRLDKRTDKQFAGCEGKERFGSRELANKVARRRTDRGKPGHAYRCKHCDGYHIGSPKR